MSTFLSTSTDDLQPPSFSRATWAEINLDALRANARAIKDVVGPHVALLAVIKANAYGHGALPVARALLHQPLTDRPPSAKPSIKPVVQMLGVASVDEGLQLRAAGIEAPILLLSAMLPEEAPAAVRAGLIPTVFTLETARTVQEAAMRENRRAPIHVKLDTGMTRLGVWHEEAASLLRAVCQLPHLRVEGIYTHLACADEEEDAMTPCQLEAFRSALCGCRQVLREYSDEKVLLHVSNSAAALRYAAAHFDMVRPGITLYGASPLPDSVRDVDALRPVMTLRARVTNVRDVPAGTSVSYGATWRAPRPTRLATLPIGYADGYPRCLSNRAEVLVRGIRCPVVGRVTMDQILVDCSHLDPAVQIGELVTLWGKGLPVEEVAAWAETISYELLCGVAHRVPRVYINS